MKKKDRRYSIAQEYCGYDTPRWVVRFCDDWIGQRATLAKAQELRDSFDTERVERFSA